MNKTELIKAAAFKCAMSQTEMEKALNAIVASIEESVKREETVTLIGFGSFSVKERAARKGRNLATGKPIQIAAKKVVKFKVGSHLKFTTPPNAKKKK